MTGRTHTRPQATYGRRGGKKRRRYAAGDLTGGYDAPEVRTAQMAHPAGKRLPAATSRVRKRGDLVPALDALNRVVEPLERRSRETRSAMDDADYRVAKPVYAFNSADELDIDTMEAWAHRVIASRPDLADAAQEFLDALERSTVKPAFASPSRNARRGARARLKRLKLPPALKKAAAMLGLDDPDHPTFRALLRGDVTALEEKALELGEWGYTGGRDELLTLAEQIRPRVGPMRLSRARGRDRVELTAQMFRYAFGG